jgi:hypothetical protein
MMTKSDTLTWLRQRTEEYRTRKLGMNEAVEDFDDVGKLGHGFVSVNELEVVDLGRGGVKRSTYVSMKLPGGGGRGAERKNVQLA